jgi:hypothetical protein
MDVQDLIPDEMSQASVDTPGALKRPSGSLAPSWRDHSSKNTNFQWQSQVVKKTKKDKKVNSTFFT